MSQSIRKVAKKWGSGLSPYAVDVLILCIFIVLTIVETYPVVLKMRTSIYGYPGDSFGAIWGTWWRKWSRLNHLPGQFTPLISAPFGRDLSGGVPPQPTTAFMDVMMPLADEVFAYNAVVLLGFPLSAFAMYLLVYRVTKNRLAGMVSGLVFSFSPFHFWHSFNHLSFIPLQWMPLYVLFLLKMHEERGLRNIILCSLFAATATTDNAYYGYFMVIFTLAFLLCRIGYTFAIEKRIHFNLGMARTYLLTLTLYLAFILPFYYPVFQTISSKTEETRKTQAYQRPYTDLFILSARPWDYLLPSVDHPLFSRYSEAIYARIAGFNRLLRSAPVLERTIYLGYIPLSLGAYAVIRQRNEKKQGKGSKRLDFAVPFFAIAALAMVWVSAPPFIPLGVLFGQPFHIEDVYSYQGPILPFPSYFLYKVFPMFRVYARFGIVVLLCVSVLAGIGLMYILERIRSKGKQLLVTGFVASLVLFEFLNIPPFHVTDFSTTPPVYPWLAQQPGDFIIAEYPMPYEYGLFYQRIHRKRMLNSHGASPLAEDIQAAVGDITNQETPAKLGALGTKYAVVHTQELFPDNLLAQYAKRDPITFYRGYEEPVTVLPPLQPIPPGLKLVQSFPEAMVYEVTDHSAKMLVLRKDQPQQPEFWVGGREWEWTGEQQRLYVLNTLNRSVALTLQFTIASSPSSQLQVFVDGSPFEDITISSAPRQVVLEQVTMGPGEHVLLFRSLQGETTFTLSQLCAVGQL